jgi:hypothetical protein
VWRLGPREQRGGALDDPSETIEHRIGKSLASSNPNAIVIDPESSPPHLELRPVRFREATEFIRDNHRHHRSPQGWLFGIGVERCGALVGVVVVGRPVARLADDGFTAEVTRCCTDGTRHVASKLYAAARRATAAMGYRTLITYTLASESGTSLRAAGWRPVGMTAGGSWSRPNRERLDQHPTCAKMRWEAPGGAEPA